MRLVSQILLVVAYSGAAIATETPDAQEAQEALSRGDYRRAEQIYRGLIAKGASSPELLNNLGIALHFEGKSSEAIHTFLQVLKRKQLPGALAYLGINYCKLRQYDDATPILRQAKQYFSDPDVVSVLGPCYLEAGDPLDAVAAYRELVDRRIQPIDENTVNLARAYFRASKYFLNRMARAPANDAYVRAIKAAQQNPSSNARGAFAQAFNEAPYMNDSMSVEELGNLLPKHPDDAALLYVIGVRSGEDGMKTFLSCQEHYGSSSAVRRLHAEMLASQGRDEEGIHEYEMLIAAATAAASASLPPEGTTEKTRITASPENSNGPASLTPELYHDLAMLYRKRGEWDKALQAFKQERKSGPDDERAQVGISECLLQLNRYDELLNHVKPVLNGDHPPEWALLDAASAEQNLGKDDEAIRYLRRIVSLYPQNSTAHYRLSRLYNATNQTDLARQEIEIFRRLKGSQPCSGCAPRQ
jgi:tetratricopeptide (TPR) repeat protein